ncbi:hypothetical protein HDE_02480 [Halotydeus destructor]|nr:hypothetical protein HDE_02480 [Halotydeus destructor]
MISTSNTETTYEAIDIMLMTVGAKLYLSNSKLKLCNALMMTVFYGIFMYVYLSGNTFSSDESTAFGQLGIWCNLAMPFVTQVMYLTKRKSIKDLLSKISGRLTLQDEIKIRTLSRRFLVTYISSCLCSGGTFVYLVLYEPVTFSRIIRYWTNVSPECQSWYHAVYASVPQITLCCIFIPSSFMISAMLYLVILLSLTKLEENLILTTQTLECYEKSIEQQLDLNCLKSQFNDSVNTFPLLWFSSLFMQSSGLILYLRDGTIGIFALWRIACFIVHLFITTVLLVNVILAQRRTKARQKRILDNLPVDKMDVQLFAHQTKFVRVISERIEYDAILFKLDESVILAFAGALVTFTVMFTQLSK